MNQYNNESKSQLSWQRVVRYYKFLPKKNALTTGQNCNYSHVTRKQGKMLMSHRPWRQATEKHSSTAVWSSSALSCKSGRLKQNEMWLIKRGKCWLGQKARKWNTYQLSTQNRGLQQRKLQFSFLLVVCTCWRTSGWSESLFGTSENKICYSFMQVNACVIFLGANNNKNTNVFLSQT